MLNFIPLLTNEHIRSIVDLMPDEWLEKRSSFQSREGTPPGYVQFLETRFAHSQIFLKEAQHAATTLI
jgi:hypothetical protein